MIEDYDKPLLPDGPPPELAEDEYTARVRKFNEAFARTAAQHDALFKRLADKDEEPADE